MSLVRGGDSSAESLETTNSMLGGQESSGESGMGTPRRAHLSTDLLFYLQCQNLCKIRVLGSGQSSVQLLEQHLHCHPRHSFISVSTPVKMDPDLSLTIHVGF